MINKWLLIFALLPFWLTAHGQTTVEGFVDDSVSHDRLAGASVTLIRVGKPLRFTRTDARGHFSIRVTDVLPGDSLQAACLGYRKCRVAAVSDRPVVVSMVPEAFTLKEVQVTGSRVFGMQDTITYDLTRFANERDNSLKDVLRKLPGVDVGEDGRVSWNGKDISRFTVEGLDLTGGRYNQLEENIKAKDVKKAEIIEHDQPVKALRNKVLTDQVAMNIGLKEEARDKLMPTLKPYLQVGEPTHVGGSVNVLQVGRKRQWMYDAAYDRSGRDLSQNMRQLASYSGRLSPAVLPAWLHVPAIAAPIDADRLRFNTSQRYGINRIRKGREDSELRFSANYMRSVERQHTHNRSVYDLGGSAPVETGEDNRLLLQSDEFVTEVEHKVNTEKAYGNEVLQVSASQGDGLSHLADTLSQRIRTPQVDVAASLYRMFTLGRSQLSWLSVADWHHSVADLVVDDDRLRLRTNLFHTAHSIGWTLKKMYFTQQYTFSVEACNLNVQGSNVEMGASLAPYWQYERGKWILSFTPRVSWQHYVSQHRSFLLLRPTLYMRRKVGHHSEWTLTGSYNESTDDMDRFVLPAYRTDYRSYYAATGIVPRDRSLVGFMNYHYKRPIQEVFVSASLSGGRTWHNAASDLRIVDGRYYTSLIAGKNRQDHWQAMASVSKGFYQLHLKARIMGIIGAVSGEQYSSGKAVAYTVRSCSLSPQLEYASRWGAISYQGQFGWHASATEHTLSDWKQSLILTSTVGRFDLSWAMTHYRNELQAASAVHVLMADATAVCRLKKLRLSASVRNLFNKKQYALTQYTGVGTFTDTYTLRGRELMLSAQFAF